jgi:hypothetical protein
MLPGATGVRSRGMCDTIAASSTGTNVVVATDDGVVSLVNADGVARIGCCCAPGEELVAIKILNGDSGVRQRLAALIILSTTVESGAAVVARVIDLASEADGFKLLMPAEHALQLPTVTDPVRVLCCGAEVIVSHLPAPADPPPTAGIALTQSGLGLSFQTEQSAAAKLASYSSPLLCLESCAASSCHVAGYADGVISVVSFTGASVWCTTVPGPAADLTLFTRSVALTPTVETLLRHYDRPSWNDTPCATLAAIVDASGRAFVVGPIGAPDCRIVAVDDRLVTELPEQESLALSERSFRHTPAAFSSRTQLLDTGNASLTEGAPAGEPLLAPTVDITGTTLVEGPLAIAAVDVNLDGFVELVISTAEGHLAICSPCFASADALSYRVSSTRCLPSQCVAISHWVGKSGVVEIGFFGPWHSVAWNPTPPAVADGILRRRLAALAQQGIAT